VETTVRWAGQSIATSGVAVMVVAVALTLSGISFLSELGIALLVSVFFALIVNLTVLPSILVLVGPRIFWPNSGARFQRYAHRRLERIATHRDPIAQAGRISTRRPLAVIGLILLLSIPVVAVALEVPVSYDVTNIGLPASNPAQVGFVHLTDGFGASYSSPSFVLVTFPSAVVSRSGPNDAELQEINGLAMVMNATPGIASVSTLVGPGSAPLGTWLNFSGLPPAEKIGLNASIANFVGTDWKTVLFNLQTKASGFSASAIAVLNALRGRVATYDAAHPGVTQTYYGGAAPTTQDIESLVSQAEEEMLIGAALGLFVIMLLILGSAFVPLLALGVIGLSILWSWAATYFVVGILENEALIFLLPLILIVLVLGLGMDYNVLLLTRVQEERGRGNGRVEAIQDAVTHAGGVITAAAVILGGAFLLLGFTSPLGLLAAIGLGIGFAVLLQAFVVQLFFTPAVLTVGKDWIWKGLRRAK
jgi:RND superfamily putative drug exporter